MTSFQEPITSIPEAISAENGLQIVYSLHKQILFTYLDVAVNTVKKWCSGQDHEMKYMVLG